MMKKTTRKGGERLRRIASGAMAAMLAVTLSMPPGLAFADDAGASVSENTDSPGIAAEGGEPTSPESIIDPAMPESESSPDQAPPSEQEKRAEQQKQEEPAAKESPEVPDPDRERPRVGGEGTGQSLDPLLLASQDPPVMGRVARDLSTISGTASMVCLNPGPTNDHYNRFGITMPDGQYVVGHCMDYGQAAPADGTYDFTGVWDPAERAYKVTLDTAGANKNPGSLAPYPCQRVGNFYWTPKGSIELYKSSSNPGMTNGNPAYSFAGGKFDVYRANDDGYVLTLTLDSAGRATASDVPYGSYYAVETVAPAGYHKDATPIRFDVSGVATIKAENTPYDDPIYALLHKMDPVTGGTAQGGGSLSGAEFTVKYYSGYYASGVDPATLGIKPAGTWVMGTGDNGRTYFTADYILRGDPFYIGAAGTPSFPLGTVTVQETKPPEGYLLSTPTRPNSVFVQRITKDGIDGKTAEVWNEHEFLDDVIRGGVEIRKVDADTGLGQPQGGATFAGTKVAIKNRNANPVVVEGKTYDKDATVKTLALDAAGKASTAADLLPYGRYSYVEASSPTGYLVDSAERYFDIVENGKIVVLDGNAAIRDEVIRGGVEIRKVDADTGLGQPQGGATFAGTKVAIKTENANPVVVEGKTYSKGAVVKTLSLDAAGKAVTAADLLPYGHYSYVETGSPTGYLIDNTVREFDITTDGKIVLLDGAAAIRDKVKAGDVSLTKFAQPVVPGSNPDIKDPLPNVSFDIVNDNANPVKRKDGSLAKKGEAVATVTTDARGYAETTGGTLAYGKYHLHERPETVPPGYRPVADIPFEVFADKQKLYYILEDTTGTPVRILKVDAETGERIPGKMTFRILDERKNPVKFTVTYPTYEQITDLTTDDAGSCMLPEKLNGGQQYYLEEVVAPDGYTLNGELVPFKVDGSAGWTWENPLVIKLADKPQKGVIKVSKADAETGLPVVVPGIEFRVTAAADVVTPDGTVRAQAGDTVAELVTGEDGAAETPELYLGAYEVAETLAPDGYVLNDEPVSVELAYAGQEVEVVRAGAVVEDKPQKGVISVSKADAETGLPVVVPGIEFRVTAAADVVTPDGTVRAQAGDTVAELVTGEDGAAETPELYLGAYEVAETLAPDGYILNCEPVEVELAYAGQEVEVVRAGAVVADMPQKGVIKITKTDEADGRAVPGAVYEVTAAADVVTPDGTVRASAGDVVDTVVTGEDGSAETVELYLGDYDVRETATPDGWAIDHEIHRVTLAYAGQEVAVTRAVLETADAPTTFKLLKKAEQIDGEFIDYAGSEWHVWAEDAEGEVAFDTIATTGEDGSFALERIPHGDGLAYYCQETKTGDDYILDPEVYEFSVDEEGLIAGEPAYVLLNTNYHKRIITVEKVDEDTGQGVSGTVFTLEKWTGAARPVEAGGTDSTGEWDEVASLDSDASGDAIFEGLQFGWYRLTELYQNPGYMSPGESGLTGTFYIECSATSGVNQIQVIENAPLTVETTVDKSTIAQTSAGLAYVDQDGNEVSNVGKETYRYDVGFTSGDTNVFADEYWVTDECQMTRSPWDMRIKSVVLPVVEGDTDGRVHVLYRTNKGGSSAEGMTFSQPDLHAGDSLADGTDRFDSRGWDYLGEFSATDRALVVPDDVLGAGEYITGITLCYGAVEVGFRTTSPLSYMVGATHELDEGTVIPNAVTSHITRNWSHTMHTASGDVPKELSGPHDDASDGVVTTVVSTFLLDFDRDLKNWSTGDHSRLGQTGDGVLPWVLGLACVIAGAAGAAVVAATRHRSRKGR